MTALTGTYVIISFLRLYGHDRLSAELLACHVDLVETWTNVLVVEPVIHLELVIVVQGSVRQRYVYNYWDAIQ